MTDGLVDGLTFDTFTSKTRRLGGLGLVSSDSSNSRPPLRPQLTFLIHKHLKGPKALTTGDLLRDPSIRTNVISKQQLLSRCWLFQIGFNHLRDPKTAARRPTLLGAKIDRAHPPLPQLSTVPKPEGVVVHAPSSQSPRVAQPAPFHGYHR